MLARRDSDGLASEWSLLMPDHSSARSQIVLLGTGTPNADPARSGGRAAAACRARVKGLDATWLSIAFLTHLHSDHTAGYPDLILSAWVLGRKDSLRGTVPRG